MHEDSVREAFLIWDTKLEERRGIRAVQFFLYLVAAVATTAGENGVGKTLKIAPTQLHEGFPVFMGKITKRRETRWHKLLSHDSERRCRAVTFLERCEGRTELEDRDFVYWVVCPETDFVGQERIMHCARILRGWTATLSYEELVEAARTTLFEMEGVL